MADKDKQQQLIDSADDKHATLLAAEEDHEESLSNDNVVTKYAMAADIVNAVLKEVLAAIKDGVEVGTLCDLGDKLILEKTSKVFKKEKDVLKGIAMPTCISIDNCICHYSPLRSDTPVTIHNGQMVKVDLGAHVDGFIATAAHTLVVGASSTDKVNGIKANVIMAAYNAMETVIRMLRPGLYKNMQITDMIDKIAAIYKVKPIENMLSHELKKNKIDGDKQIIQNPGEKQRSEITKCSFDKHEAYAIDILMSTGEGKTRDLDTRTTVYKKADDLVYSLKLKSSRAFFSSAVNKYGAMPFSLRLFEDERAAKLGVIECERRALMRPYQVLYERDGEFVAQFKATVLVMPNGLLKITGLPLDTTCIDCEIKIDDPSVLSLLNSSLKPKKSKKKSDGNAEKKIVAQSDESTKKVTESDSKDTAAAAAKEEKVDECDENSVKKEEEQVV